METRTPENKHIASYEKRRKALYDYKVEQTLHAAEAFADSCDRCHAEYNRLTIVQFCINSFPEIIGADALDIANTIRGQRIHCQ